MSKLCQTLGHILYTFSLTTTLPREGWKYEVLSGSSCLSDLSPDVFRSGTAWRSNHRPFRNGAWRERLGPSSCTGIRSGLPWAGYFDNTRCPKVVCLKSCVSLTQQSIKLTLHFVPLSNTRSDRENFWTGIPCLLVLPIFSNVSFLRNRSS